VAVVKGDTSQAFLERNYPYRNFYPANDINVLASFLDITERKHMEEELRRNIEELERFNELAIGREIKMIQLKEEIKELLCQLNQDKRYKVVK